jgi:hypothetical protein
MMWAKCLAKDEILKNSCSQSQSTVPGKVIDLWGWISVMEKVLASIKMYNSYY